MKHNIKYNMYSINFFIKKYFWSLKSNLQNISWKDLRFLKKEKKTFPMQVVIKKFQRFAWAYTEK